MTSSNTLSIYIRKLGNPIKEIRERSLQLLRAKLHLGWELDDELTFTRELLEALLAWFDEQKPTLQREALDLLLGTIKTKAGSYIAKEFGLKRIFRSLNNIRTKLEDDALEVYQDLVDTLKFINTVDSDDNIMVPRLPLSELNSSASDSGSQSNIQHSIKNFLSSKETSSSSDIRNNHNGTTNNDGIKLLLFPWVELCSSDLKTMLLVEDAFKLLKSTRRCCRFIRDVFLRDFPPEIFLNRPEIVKTLIAISDDNQGGRPVEALLVLLCLTHTLNKRVLELCSLDLIHQIQLLPTEYKDSEDDINIELQNITGLDGHFETVRREDGIAVLKQLPAPIYALDTLQAVLSVMTRSITLLNPMDKTEILNLKELNICLCLVDTLIELLLGCVTEEFWNSDHGQKVYRDIAHKSNVVMRTVGDLLMKFRKSFFEDTGRTHHRVVWLHLVFCSEKLLQWSQCSAMPPTSLVTAVQAAQLDPALEMFYPDVGRRIADYLQNSKVPKEFKSKYRELKKIYASMEEANNFMKNRNNCRSSKKVLSCIKKSLPVLEVFQNEKFLDDISDVLLTKPKEFDMNDNDWSVARSVTISLMAHKAAWIQIGFYKKLSEMVKGILMTEVNQTHNEKCLTLICDVGVLTELCCHGLSSKYSEVQNSASDILLYLLRGRLVLSESCWWKLLASLLPVLPLVHIYAAHETQIGQAICKTLELDIAECMGISLADTMVGLVRLLFVRCVAVQLESAHFLCRLLDDERYLPPKEALRADVLLNALRRVECQDFNIDDSSATSRTPQTSGLIQILEVLKQDIVISEDGLEFISRMNAQPLLEPSLRRSTLQQLAVLMRQQESHDTFLQCDGVKVIVALLRMSLTVDDYLAFPECAISCVSVLNSVCFVGRHSLAKVPDLLPLLIRTILVFPANESAVSMAAQIMAIVAWAGFVLQELDSSRRRVPALPLCVIEKTSLPFRVNSYWNTSPNSEHSYVEWLLSEEEWRAAVRVRWWSVSSGSSRSLSPSTVPSAPLALQPCKRDIAALRASDPLHSCSKALLALENATSHSQVNEALWTLESYIHLLPHSSADVEEFSALPWHHTRRFLCAPPASSRDTSLLVTLLNFLKTYMDTVPNNGDATSWIGSYFVGNDATIISLLGREQLYQQQTASDSIEVTQLHIHIVKIILRCVTDMDIYNNHDNNRMESLLKILLACLERIDLKNFHMLGYFNELLRCIKHVLHLRFCKLSEVTLVLSLKVMAKTLSGCASGGGRKGQASRLDVLLSLLALLRQIHRENTPVPRWSEVWSSGVMNAVVQCSRGACARLRAAALQVMAALAYYAQLLPHLLQAVQEESLSQFALSIFVQTGESNAVRTAALFLLAAVASRATPRSNDVLESEVLENLRNYNFLENCLDILVVFCNMQEYKHYIEPNISCSELDRRSEFEVRAQKSGEVRIPPSHSQRVRPPPTAALVTALADALHNISAFAHHPAQEWNDRGLHRLLFRCVSWSKGSREENGKLQSAAARALFSVTSHKPVRAALAGTKDCLHNFLVAMTPLDFAGDYTDCLLARKESLLLLAALLPEKSAADSVWTYLREVSSDGLFRLLHQCLEIDETGLQDAGLYCLTELLQSAARKRHVDKSKDATYIDFYDNLKSSFVHDSGNLVTHCSGDEGRIDNCQPEYMAEEISKALLLLYQKICLESKSYNSSQDYRWVSTIACLCSALACSARSRAYAVHRCAPRVLLDALRSVRDHLSMHGKPADVIRNANHNPVLQTLYWLLTMINCMMTESQAAKDSFAEDNIAASLNKLWPWCMMTDQLRQAVMNLLHTFSNDCPKAWAAMCACVGGRSLALECCALVGREAGRTTHRHDHTLLRLGIDTLRHCLAHHHCRTIILKSEVLGSMYKMCVRERSRGSSGPGAWWAATCESAARHAEGAAALLALVSRGAVMALAPQMRAALMPAIAHAAHHHRVTFLQSPELLELLSGTLLTGDTGEVISAARAVWALAANNHKAKLLLRSAGVAAAVHSALQKLQRSAADPTSQRALQLLTYTNTVLQTT